MNENVSTPTIYEDKTNDFLLIGLEQLTVDSPLGESTKMVGLGLLRNSKGILNKHYIDINDIKIPNQATIRAALELNRKQMKDLVLRAQQVIQLYEKYEMDLVDRDGINPSLITLDNNGCADLNEN